ncbi:universal stress protein [Rathayibacter soli]|uniref:universal stress protein n=1 Tax=Rathayibacter soli TaxID=3144168 RepID=UPI0027E44782|nr:universal stress protein [Glaciibacter superstes]
MQTVIVGWDRGEASWAALRWTVERSQDSTVLLMQVTDADLSSDPTASPESPAVGALAWLQDDLARARNEHPHVKFDSELVSGDTVAELARHSGDSTLVVVGSDRRQGGGFRYRWSIGAKLAARARGPVGVIPVGGNSNDGDIVVGVDGSPASHAALEFAAREADRTGAAVQAVLAWQESPVWLDATVPDVDYLQSLEVMYAELLDGALVDFQTRHPELQVLRRLTRGPASKVLLDAAQTARLLVVGNRAYRGVGRFFLGSVSRAVVAGTPCPVVVCANSAIDIHPR